MTGICLVAGLLAVQFGDAITLRWTHSIQKTVWEEDYRHTAGMLHLVEARIRGTGAGMEPPAGAVLENGAWHYAPAMPPIPRIALSHSSHVPPYVICDGRRCREVTAWLPGLPQDIVMELAPCDAAPRQ